MSPIQPSRVHGDAPGPFEPVGGAVPLASQFYVSRPSDSALDQALDRGDSIVLVRAGRQMGKTSLLARGLQKVRGLGCRVVLTDFQSLNASHLKSPSAFFMTLAEAMADQCDLEVWPDEAWDEHRSPHQNFERYLRSEVLGTTPGRVVWGLDEVDRLFFCPFSSDVFGMFRSWHNRRALDPAGPWRRLTLAISYATESRLFITEINQSPFNIGTRLALEDFTPDQVADLNRRHGSPLRGRAELRRFYDLVGGHPFLVRRALLEMVARGARLSLLAEGLDRDEGIFGEHLQRILLLLLRDPQLCEVVRDLLRGSRSPTPESFYRLTSAGLLTGVDPDHARFRCGLYSAYLSRNLLSGLA